MKFISTSDIFINHQTPEYMLGEYTPERHPRLDKIRRGCSISHFNGVDALLHALPEHFAGPKGTKQSSQYDRGFHVFPTYEEALETFTKNPSKVRKFTEADLTLHGGDTNGITLEYDVTGDMLDIGRFLDGEPEVFVSLIDGAPRGKRVHIVMGLNQSGGAATEDILTRSKRVVRLVDWLESQNVRAQVTGVASNECHHMEIEAKLYHDPLDLNAIAVLAHSDFLRRLNFRMVEHSKTYSSDYGSSIAFGGTVSSHPDMIDSDELEEVVLYVGNQYNRGIDNQFDLLEKKLVSILSGEIEARKLIVLG